MADRAPSRTDSIETLMKDLAEEKQAIWRAQVQHVKNWCADHNVNDGAQLRLLEGLRASFRTGG